MVFIGVLFFCEAVKKNSTEHALIESLLLYELFSVYSSGDTLPHVFFFLPVQFTGNVYNLF